MTANPNPDPTPNPKGRETKMESLLHRSTLEEENYSSAPESPAENNQREKSPPLPSKAIGAVDRYSHGPVSSPVRSQKESPSPEGQQQPQPQPQQRNVGGKPGSPVVVVNRSMREELAVANKVDPGGGVDGFVTGHGHGAEDGVADRRSRAVAMIIRRTRMQEMVTRAALGIRLLEVIFCLVSFSVMGADKTRGWAGDSFDRYKEYRYCISVNIIGFVYAGFQAYDMAFYLIFSKHVIRHPLRAHLDFSLDQMLTYLLISASSSAGTRVDDWVSNWGKDEFTEMASASIAMSFLAFFAFAVSSLISGYQLCTRNFP